jgi:hypothetical protein
MKHVRTDVEHDVVLGVGRGERVVVEHLQLAPVLLLFLLLFIGLILLLLLPGRLLRLLALLPPDMTSANSFLEFPSVTLMLLLTTLYLFDLLEGLGLEPVPRGSHGLAGRRHALGLHLCST